MSRPLLAGRRGTPPRRSSPSESVTGRACLVLILKEEEGRPKLDIHRFGERILGRVKDEVRNRSLGPLVMGSKAMDENDTIITNVNW